MSLACVVVSGAAEPAIGGLFSAFNSAAAERALLRKGTREARVARGKVPYTIVRIGQYATGGVAGGEQLNIQQVKAPSRPPLDPLQTPSRPSPGVDCRPAMWQSVGREYTSNIRWNIRNAVR
eukprot:1176343-Prorocentrum_minimum.AAC.3